MWALCFAAKNRVNFRHLPDDNNIPVQDIPLHLYLPSQDEYDNLKMRMEVIAMRIIKEHIPAFSECEVQQHIPHQYSFESSMRSRIVSDLPSKLYSALNMYVFCDSFVSNLVLAFGKQHVWAYEF